MEYLLQKLEEDCAKLGVYFDSDKLYLSLDRDTQLSLNSRDLDVEGSDRFGCFSDRLPRKIGVYRNYLGGGISGGIGRGEINTGDEDIDERLGLALDLFYDTLIAIEKESFEEETEWGANRFQGGLRVR